MNYPTIQRNISTFEAQKEYVSIDFEFNPDYPETPTIAGYSSGENPVSNYFSDQDVNIIKHLEEKKVSWAGHNSVTVEKKLIEKIVGHEVSLDHIEDTMILHYLCNAELCKGVAKEEEDDSDPHGQGYMDLWSMASLYTDLPQWKQCRGEDCNGGCRTHDILGYNGLDALSVDIAFPRLKQEALNKGIPDKLYQNLKKLTVLCDWMSSQGIFVDRELIGRMEEEFDKRKDAIFSSRIENKIGKKGQILKGKVKVWDAPFNPRSPKQVEEWFIKNGVKLRSTEKDEIEYALKHLSPATESIVKDLLEKLYDYKDEGKGLKAWFNERYFDKNGLMHPRFIVTGTSTGRLSSADPNFQNIPRVGFGKNVRAAVIPRHKDLILVKADKSQLELRVVLWYSGIHKPLPGDAFNWLVEQGKGVFEEMTKTTGRSARDNAKSVSYGGSYLEGVKVFYPSDLKSSYIKKTVECGALILHKDWEYHGGIIGFTGINLADRLFGSATFENRKKALEIQQAYFKKFSSIHLLHRRISEQADRGFVQSKSGRYLVLLGSAEDKLKIAAAFYGQGGGADDVQEGMLRYYEMKKIPLIQVHDELVFELPRETSDEKIKEFFEPFTEPSEYMEGFQCPVKVSVGENWKEMREI